jgi:hypothetical protein
MTKINPINHPTNLDRVNLDYISSRDYQNYFNNFFEVPVQVSSNIDAAVISYFETVTDNKESAKAMASAVIYTSIKQGNNPMEILQEFQKLSVGQLNEFLVAFLNLERVGSSYIGLRVNPVTNKYVSRLIRF